MYEAYVVSVHYNTSGSASVEKLKHCWGAGWSYVYVFIFCSYDCIVPVRQKQQAGTSLHMHAYLVTTGHGRHASCGEMVSIELAPGSLVYVGTKGNLFARDL